MTKQNAKKAAPTKGAATGKGNTKPKAPEPATRPAKRIPTAFEKAADRVKYCNAQVGKWNAELKIAETILNQSFNKQ